MMKALQFKKAWVLAVLLWLGVIAAGYSFLLHYSFAAGKTIAAPAAIPPAMAPQGVSRKAQLFLALHPHCPCSRATLRELAKILTRAPAGAEVTVLMYKPNKQSDRWMEGGLLDDCRRMNCRVVPDPEGKAAASLGSLTSGGAVLYDGNGSLRYQGGITPGRGHEGDNIGATAIVEILRGKQGSCNSMPVFGCPIQEEAKK